MTPVFRSLFTLVLILSLTPALPAGAQTADRPAGEFGEEVQVNEVLLDVLVTDREGNVVLGLDESDFVVEENGEPVELTGLTFYSNSRFVGSSTQAASLAVDEIPVDRYFILFFHDPGRDFDDLANGPAKLLEAGREARRWAEEELLPTDWVAVVSYDYKLKVHQDFVRDKRQVLAAVDDAVVGKDPGGNWPSRIEGAEGPSLRAHLPQGKELRRASTRVYDALRILAEAAGEVRGRKNLVLFSRGFGLVDSFGNYRPDTRYFRPMARALNNNNVAVYAVDLTPVNVDHIMSDALSHIAFSTGGRYYNNFVNFIVPLRELAEENSGYYLLSYRSRRPADATGYQEVKVEVKNPQFKVRAREGYLYGATETQKQASR